MGTVGQASAGQARAAGSARDAKDDLKSLPVPEVEKRLGSSAAGLTGAEAEKRLARDGPNEIAEKKDNPFLKLLTYFWGPIPWMIEAAVILSGVLRHWPDFVIILVLLAANAMVGFWEEHQAGKAIDALKAQLAVKCRVRRDGDWVTPPSRELVPGDVIRMRMGDIVPADARLLDGDPVQVDQSALTGESLPVTAGPGAAVYSGSIIKQGEIGALVYATGTGTYFGKTAELVQDARTVSHFQQAVLKIGKFLILLAVGLVAVITVVSIARGNPVLDTLQFALVLTVAAIPVAMPTVLSVTMAAGARLLARKQAIVSRLVAIEELAGVDVLCSDKTGTLTQNKLTLGDPFAAGTVTAAQVILAAALASRADDDDTIDLAVLAGLDSDQSLAGYQVTHFEPFDPVGKRTEAAVAGPGGSTFRVTKGAPQVIMKLAGDSAQVKDAVDQAVGEFAARGFRSLGVARADGDGPWQFLGVLPLSDPPREDARSTIATARQLGVHVKMVTGDQVAIARETARTLGMGTGILDAASLGDAKGEETAAAAEAIENADGFAQVFPEHKYHIVDVLQERGHIVGMTGDGVNDAPALKKADCGIAVSGATDAARAAASIVLMRPGLSVIIDAVKESRRIVQRMNSYAIYRIAETLRVLLFVTLVILFFDFFPVTAIMIVMLALLNDGAILSIAYDRVRYKHQPEAWNMRLVIGMATVLGTVGPIAAFGLFLIGDEVFRLGHPQLQTLMYLMLSVAGHLTIFLTRTRGPFWSIRPARILLLAVLGTQALATLIAVYGIFMTPLGWRWAALVWAYALAWFLITDRVKLAAYKILDPVKDRGATGNHGTAQAGPPATGPATGHRPPPGRAADAAATATSPAPMGAASATGAPGTPPAHDEPSARDERKRKTMAGTAQFTIGAEASCSDGECGEVTRVIVDPVAGAVTHLVVEPRHRRDAGRLVPLDLIDATAGQIRLRCTRAEFGKLDPAEETQFLPATSHYAGYGPGQVSYWPHYGLAGGVGLGGGGMGWAGLGALGGIGMSGVGLGGGSPSQTYDTVPAGEVEIRRGDHVHATDGHIGRVQGLVIDRRSGHVTHVLLQEGHLWGRKEVAIPVSAVASTADGIRLTITRQEVEDLPPVDIDHPGGDTGGQAGHR